MREKTKEKKVETPPESPRKEESQTPKKVMPALDLLRRRARELWPMGLRACRARRRVLIDRTIDSTFVQYANDNRLIPWLKENAPATTRLVRVTDGAPQHFKLADTAM